VRAVFVRAPNPHEVVARKAHYTKRSSSSFTQYHCQVAETAGSISCWSVEVCTTLKFISQWGWNENSQCGVVQWILVQGVLISFRKIS